MKKISFSMLIIAALVVLIISSSCFERRVPLGDDNAIKVAADSTIWLELEPVLRQIFEKVEYTPQPEKAFKIARGDVNNIKRFKNIIFLSTLDATDPISSSINSSLTEESRKRVETGSIIFVKKAQWARDQITMFLVANDLPALKSKVAEQQNEIFFQFDDHWNKIHHEILYQNNEQFNIETHLLKTYGWMIRVPIDYKLEVQSARDRFVMFHRQVPLRWLSVFWIEASDPTLITKDWCIAKRNEIGKLFYENEVVEEKFESVVAEEIIFQNRPALKLKGLWKNDEKVAGGPFRMYCFFDEGTERIYFIDMHVFSPALKKGKLHYLRQMDIIANSFKTSLEITPDQISKQETR